MNCPKCRSEKNIIGIEYSHPHPERYDGVSEWRCDDCGTRWGRWSGKILADGEVEPRYGRVSEPRVAVTDRANRE